MPLREEINAHSRASSLAAVGFILRRPHRLLIVCGTCTTSANHRRTVHGHESVAEALLSFSSVIARCSCHCLGSGRCQCTRSRDRDWAWKYIGL